VFHHYCKLSDDMSEDMDASQEKSLDKGGNPQALNPKPEIPNPKPETRNPESKTLNPKP